ncbi:MAG: hypothetical protein IMZ66_12035 [Planctomycetes bacterium]|nr:hypothetical protein [Planctomycetota bacterium]
MTETFPLWIRGESEADAAAQGQAWADAEPLWTFVRVVSITPHLEFWHVWTVAVEVAPVNAAPLTLGLVG